MYTRYRSIEELPDIAKPFYEIAAKNIGISLRGLVRGVFETEVRLETWALADRKKRLMEEQGLPWCCRFVRIELYDKIWDIQNTETGSFPTFYTQAVPYLYRRNWIMIVR